MNNKDVTRAVRSGIRPALRDAGFDSFAGRRAWRHHDQTIDHVVVRSFNSDIAHGVGCTTYSFVVDAGVYYRCASDTPLDRPPEYECTFRAQICKSLRQPCFHPYGVPGPDRPDVWYVLSDGSNLEECIDDAQRSVTALGLPLIDRLTQPRLAYQALLAERSTEPDYGVATQWMPGNPNSPCWRRTVSAIGGLIGASTEQDMRSAPVLGPRPT